MQNRRRSHSRAETARRQGCSPRRINNAAPQQVGGGYPLFDFSNSRFDPSRKSEVCDGPIKVYINSTDAGAVVGTAKSGSAQSPAVVERCAILFYEVP